MTSRPGDRAEGYGSEIFAVPDSGFDREPWFPGLACPKFRAVDDFGEEAASIWPTMRAPSDFSRQAQPAP